MGNLSSSSKSLLPENVITILNESMSEGFVVDNLGLGFNNIDDSMIPELCEWIVKLGDKVKILSLDGNIITSVGASMLFDTLKNNNSSLKGVYLIDNYQIDDKCMKSLGDYIKSNKNIGAMWLDGTSVSDAGIKMLAPYLDGNTTFKELHLDCSEKITDKSIPLLMKMIESSCVDDIGINNTSITQKNTIYSLLACNAIKNGATNLNLCKKWLNDDDLINISGGMKKYGIDKLKEINLQSSVITSKGASVLFDTLKECNSVVSKLDLSYNQLDDECIKHLGEYLQNDHHVEVLGLGSNKITDKSIEILSEYLIGNSTLRELDLSHNRITDALFPDLHEIVKKSCISTLYLPNSSISAEKKQEIEKALSIPIEERDIPIKSSTKSAAKIQSSSA